MIKAQRSDGGVGAAQAEAAAQVGRALLDDAPARKFIFKIDAYIVHIHPTSGPSDDVFFATAVG